MIVGCYSLDLYCDNTGVTHPYKAFPVQYTGQTEGACMKQARRDGWRIVKLPEGKAYCPDCEKVRKAASKTSEGK